jgi:hypothetical protein
VRVKVAVPDELLDASTIDSLLEATTRAGTRQILSGRAPDIRVALERGLKWKPEPFADGEHFDLPAVVAARGWGDCDDLGPWYAASLRASGEDPRARARAVRSGPNRWHAVTQTGDGAIYDPSRAAGMGRGRARVSGADVVGVHGRAAPVMAQSGDAAIALKRGNGQWWSRCDLPWGEGHLASISPGREPERALFNAVQGALSCADGCSREHAKYARELAEGMLSPAGKQGAMFSGAFRGGPAGRSAVRSMLAGIDGIDGPGDAYGARYRTMHEYQSAVSQRPGSQAWWVDPLVAFLFASGGKRLEGLSISASGSSVSPVIKAVDLLDGFHAGQWPAVARSIEALASALNSSRHGVAAGLDRSHILDAIGYPVSALYDARVAAEKPAARPRPRLRLPSTGHVQMTVPGGANVTTPTAGGSIIVRF